MNILAIDTTSEYGSIALFRENATVEEVALHAPNGFGSILYGEIRSLLNRHRLAPGDVECYAAATGPGSFTGVRIGVTAAKALAESCDRVVAGVSTLQAMSTCGSAPDGLGRAVILDARRGDVYAAVYDEFHGTVTPEVVMPFEAWLESLPSAVTIGEFICQDFEPYAAAVAGTRFAGAPVTKAPRALASSVAFVALFQGRFLDPAALDANYVRRSDAELFWKDGPGGK